MSVPRPLLAARSILWGVLLALAGAYVLVQLYVLREGPDRYGQEIGWAASCIPRAAKCGTVEVLGLAPDVICSAAVASLAGWRGSSLPAQRAVPHIIHQSWKNAKPPERFALWAGSWKRSHPDWEYRLWTDDDNRELVVDHFPWLLHAYDRLPAMIQRADLARYLYMYLHGGVYSDLDTWCLRANDNITRGAAVTVAEMGGDKEMGHNIPNAWMASAPGHPFWLFLSRMIMHRSYAHNGRRPEDATGPVILKQALDLWRCMEVTEDTQILEPGYVFIKDWHDASDWPRLHEHCNPDTIHLDGSDERCIAAYPNAHVLTYWSHTWER